MCILFEEIGRRQTNIYDKPFINITAKDNVDDCRNGCNSSAGECKRRLLCGKYFRHVSLCIFTRRHGRLNGVASVATCRFFTFFTGNGERSMIHPSISSFLDLQQKLDDKCSTPRSISLYSSSIICVSKAGIKYVTPRKTDAICIILSFNQFENSGQC